MCVSNILRPFCIRIKVIRYLLFSFIVLGCVIYLSDFWVLKDIFFKFYTCYAVDTEGYIPRH